MIRLPRPNSPGPAGHSSGHPAAHPSRPPLREYGLVVAVTGAVTFDGIHVAPWQLLGEPGDYLREPVF